MGGAGTDIGAGLRARTAAVSHANRDIPRPQSHTHRRTFATSSSASCSLTRSAAPSPPATAAAPVPALPLPLLPLPAPPRAPFRLLPALPPCWPAGLLPASLPASLPLLAAAAACASSWMKASSDSPLALLLSNCTSPAGQHVEKKWGWTAQQHAWWLEPQGPAAPSSHSPAAQPSRWMTRWKCRHRWVPKHAGMPAHMDAIIRRVYHSPWGWRSCGSCSSVMAPEAYRRITSPATTVICGRAGQGRCSAVSTQRCQQTRPDAWATGSASAAGHASTLATAVCTCQQQPPSNHNPRRRWE